ncbi:ABC transporter substrate-binding protein [Burkholderia alba]|uniref:ABC transporter substrate-binding protein n=1 Tax=Burkholderia alba TaxID=2683677 RepID=UPI002B05507A|nr:ABC transporter substrate-binding protein [Burkholderia alba]
MTRRTRFDPARRRALAGLGAALAASGWPLFAPAAFAAEAAAPRVVVLDWPLTEVVLSLGVVPVGVSRPPWYMKLDGVPPLPPSVVDTGLLFQPNFEVLQALEPDVIVITPWHAPLRALLERVAPTCVVQLSGPGIDVYPAVRAATRQLGRRLGRRAQADALLAHADAQLADIAPRLAAFRALRRPLYLLRPIDDRHITVFGANSLFGGVLDRLGLANAWQGATDPQGAAEAELAALAAHGDTQVLTIGVPPGVAAQLARSPLWNALPFVKQNRVQPLGAMPPLGGVVASMRFASGLAQALQGVTT